MPAPKGNAFWKMRSKHGRDKIFQDPKILRESCYEYFQWVEDNPLYEDKVYFFQGYAMHEPAPKMRAMSIAGICVFLGITPTTWFEYKKLEGFSDVICEAENIMYTQKFEGASADLLNQNIIARDLGLKDKTDLELSGKNGDAISHKVEWIIQPVKPINEV